MMWLNEPERASFQTVEQEGLLLFCQELLSGLGRMDLRHEPRAAALPNSIGFLVRTGTYKPDHSNSSRLTSGPGEPIRGWRQALRPVF